MFDGVRLEDASAHQLRMALAIKATELEVDVVSGADAAGLVEDFARIEAIGHSALVLSAHRAVESGVWKRKGHKTPAHWLAAVAGVSVTTAQRILATSKRIKDQPTTRKSATKGNLGRDKLHDVSEAAGAAPDQEDDLVGNAERDSVASNRERCKNTKANAMSDEEKRRQSQRNRYVRRRSQPDGSAGLEYMAPSDQAAEVFAALEHFQRQVFDAARKAGTPRESFENHTADAMLAMARAAMGNGNAGKGGRVAKPQITIRIDWEALKRGAAQPGETCDIPGVGPVPVATVRALLDDALVRVVVTRGIDVVNVAHHSRGVSAHQRTGLQWMHTKCSVLGCDNTVAIEYDHRRPWSEERITAFLNMDPLCSHHHYLKGHRKHRLEPGTGRRRMLGPDEPDPATPANGPTIPRPTPFPDPETDRTAGGGDGPGGSDRTSAGASAGASSPFEADTDDRAAATDDLAEEIIDLRDPWPDAPASHVDPGTGGSTSTGDRSPPVDATLF